jgi:hypothetical protein
MKFDVSGEPLHTRCLDVALAQGGGDASESSESDGLNGSIEFRAHVLDLRKSGLMELAGHIATAGIIHRMELRGAFSSATGTLERIEWEQSHVAHEANHATNGECCRDPMVRLKGLVGTPLGAGFASELKQCFGGPLGCSHITTLLQELSAVVAGLGLAVVREPELQVRRQPGERIAQRSVFLDAFAQQGSTDTDVSVRVADLRLGGADAVGNERVFSHEEARVVAEVDLATWQINGAHAGERRRRAPSFEPGGWVSRSHDLGVIVERSLGGGMARLCLEHFGDRPADALLLSALLNLAPGMTQVGAAISDSLGRSSANRPEGTLTGPGPCYMLRADGPLMKSLFANVER